MDEAAAVLLPQLGAVLLRQAARRQEGHQELDVEPTAVQPAEVCCNQDQRRQLEDG